MRKLKVLDPVRANYELEVLQSTVYFTSTDDTLRALIREKYEAVLRERCKSVPTQEAA
jgi:hypothetical protein